MLVGNVAAETVLVASWFAVAIIMIIVIIGAP